MPALVAGGIIRCSLIHDIQGEQAVNVLDFHSGDDSVGQEWDREYQGRTVASNVLNAWVEHIQPQLHTTARFMRVDWLDLNSLDGPAGSVSSTEDHTLPQAGASSSGDPMPSLNAMVVRKAGSSGRGKRAGRLFLAGLGEGQSQGNQWLPLTLTAINTAFGNFLPQVTEESPLNGHTYWPVTVHTRLGEFTGDDKITDFDPDPFVSSQVRRKPGR